MADTRFLLLHAPGWSVTGIPYSLALVAGIIEEAGWQVTVLDFNQILYALATAEEKRSWEGNVVWFDEAFVRRFLESHRDDVQTRLRDAGCDTGAFALIGCSVNNYNRLSSLVLGTLLAPLNTAKTPVLFGGADCFPFEYHTGYLSNPIFVPDAMLCGEAESCLGEFLHEFERTGSVRTAIPGFLYRDDDGRIVDGGRPALPDLSRTRSHAVYTPFPMRDYPPRLWIASSRGCINHCNFCNEHVNFTRYRSRNLETVRQEITLYLQALRDSGITDPIEIQFSESILNANIRHLRALVDMLLELRDDVAAWGAQSSFRVPIPEDLFRDMRQSHCRWLFWGFESGSQAVVNLMGKNYSLEQAVDTLRLASSLGITSSLPLVAGFPGETPADILETITFIFRFIDEPTISFPYASMLELKHGTPLERNMEGFGICDLSPHQWSTVDGRNTQGVREFRAGVLGLCIFSIPFEEQGASEEGYAGMLKASLGFLQGPDFNSLPLALEMYTLLSLLHEALHRKDDFLAFVDGLRDAPLDCRGLLRLRRLSAAALATMPDNACILWAALDKNRHKSRIIEFLRDTLEAYRNRCRSAALLSLSLLPREQGSLEVLVADAAGADASVARFDLAAGKLQEHRVFIPPARLDSVRLRFAGPVREVEIRRVSLSQGLKLYFDATGAALLESFAHPRLSLDGAATGAATPGTVVLRCGQEETILACPAFQIR